MIRMADGIVSKSGEYVLLYLAQKSHELWSGVVGINIADSLQ